MAKMSWVLVAHICNPSIDQEDGSSKPARENSSPDPISEKRFIQKKIGLVEWLKVKALSSSPSTTQKRKKRRLKCQWPILTKGSAPCILDT
jgi:hypothetical protein